MSHFLFSRRCKSANNFTKICKGEGGTPTIYTDDFHENVLFHENLISSCFLPVYILHLRNNYRELEKQSVIIHSVILVC